MDRVLQNRLPYKTAEIKDSFWDMRDGRWVLFVGLVAVIGILVFDFWVM